MVVIAQQVFEHPTADLNALDLALYEWVRDDLMPVYAAEYGDALEQDLERFREFRQARQPPRLALLLAQVLRQLYGKPVTGLIRMRNGLPYAGSYTD